MASLSSNLPFSHIMKRRICDLGVSLEDNGIHELVEQLHRELANKGFAYLRPRAYVGDEWFSPEGSTLISIPFYLCHPRLVKLEQSVYGRAEGQSRDWAMRLLRHEAGHCFDHAYGLSRKREWQEVFGSPRRKYDVETYSYDPDSTDFVHNLDGYYAQSHPEEDFAETFAVYLNPRSRWKTSYRRWPGAYEKLEYVEYLVHTYGDEPIQITGYQRPMAEAKYLKRTVAAYYRQKNRSVTA